MGLVSPSKPAAVLFFCGCQVICGCTSRSTPHLPSEHGASKQGASDQGAIDDVSRKPERKPSTEPESEQTPVISSPVASVAEEKESASEETEPPPRPAAAPRVEGLKPLATLQHGGDVLRVAFSSDGQLLASASNDSIVRTWSMPHGRLRRVFGGHRDGATGVDVSPDGQPVNVEFDKIENVKDPIKARLPK
jgi:WD40 repeat protein